MIFAPRSEWCVLTTCTEGEIEDLVWLGNKLYVRMENKEGCTMECYNLMDGCWHTCIVQGSFDYENIFTGLDNFLYVVNTFGKAIKLGKFINTPTDYS